MQEVPLPSALPASLPGGDCRAVLSGVVAADVLDDSAVHRQVWCERWASYVSFIEFVVVVVVNQNG